MALFSIFAGRGAEDALYNSEIIKDKRNAVKAIQQLYDLQKANYDVEYDGIIDEKGNGKFEVIFHIESITDFSLIKWRIFSNEPGEIRIDEITDYYTGKKVDYISESQDSTAIAFFAMLDILHAVKFWA